MPSWKKLITSGSAASLSSLTLGTALPVSEGGTGATSLTSNGILTGNGTSAIQAESNLTFDAATGNFSSGDGSESVTHEPASNYLTIHETGATKGSHLRLATDNSDFILSAGGGTNQLSIYDVNAVANSLVMDSAGKITLRDSLKIPVGKSVFFGGSEHTYIREDIDDRLRFFVGGAEFMRFTEDTADSINLYQDVILDATKKLYLDGGGNSYIQEESADNLIFRAAGGNYLRVTGTNIVLNDPGASYDVRIEGNTDSNLGFFDGSADRVGIGTNSPKTKLHVVGTISGSQVEASGDIIAYSTSDRKFKDNIEPIQDSLYKVSQIGGYTFDWNDKQQTYTGKDVGVIAQEVQEVLPEVVTERENGLAVKYEKIVPLLIESIKELKQEIDDIKQKCDCLNK